MTRGDMVTALNWTPALDHAPRGRDEVTGLRDAAAFAQDLRVAVAGGHPLAVALVHVGRPSRRRSARIAAELAALPGFPYRTGADTFAVIAPGVAPWELHRDLVAVSRSCRRARLRAGVTVAGGDAQIAAAAALEALELAADERLAVGLR